MAVNYPDYMNEVVEASQRYEADAVQYVGSIRPQTIAPGESAELTFVLQNALNMPVDFRIKLDLPSGRRFRPCQFFAEEEITVPLGEAEVGELRLPILCGAETAPAVYNLKVEFRSLAKERGQRIRPSKSKGRLGQTVIKNVQGLQLASTIGTSFKASSSHKQTFKLAVEGEAVPSPEIDLTPIFTSLWGQKDWELQQKAVREVNERRIHIVPELTPPIVYVSLLHESRKRFELVDIDLRLGEAIFLAKILTFTVLYFLQREALQDGLLTPILQQTIEAGMPFKSGIWLLVEVGYPRLIRLAIAISFGLLEEELGRRVWTIEEQAGVNDFITGRLETGQPLPVEFMYLPLLLGSLLVTHQVVMEGEDPQQSLHSLARAKEERMADFPQDDEELQEIFGIFDNLLLAQLSGAT